MPDAVRWLEDPGTQEEENNDEPNAFPSPPLGKVKDPDLIRLFLSAGTWAVAAADVVWRSDGREMGVDAIGLDEVEESSVRSIVEDKAETLVFTDA